MPKLKRDLTMEEQLARGPMDLPFLMLVVLLTGIGVIMVFSASYATAYYDSSVAQNNPTYYFVRQGLFAVAGLAVLYVTSKINYQTFRWMSVFLLVISVVLLVLVLPFGYGRSTVGAQRWIRIPVAAASSLRRSQSWASSCTLPPACPNGIRKRSGGSPPGIPSAACLPSWTRSACWSWCPTS